MGHWIRLMPSLVLNWHWRLTCPDTIENIAQDFVENRAPAPEVLQTLDFDGIDNKDFLFAWRRRINSIYGVGTSYQHPRGHESARRGWNQRLWRNAPGIEPEALVDEIFETVINQLRRSMDKAEE
jgi:hypothetical protein